MEELAKELKDFLKFTGNSDLDSQIEFAEKLKKVFTSPITVSIHNSLIELRGIKKNKLEKLKI